MKCLLIDPHDTFFPILLQKISAFEKKSGKINILFEAIFKKKKKIHQGQRNYGVTWHLLTVENITIQAAPRWFSLAYKYLQCISACGKTVVPACQTRNSGAEVLASALTLPRDWMENGCARELLFVRFSIFQLERWCQHLASSLATEQPTRDLWAVLYTRAKHNAVFLPEGCRLLLPGRNPA